MEYMPKVFIIPVHVKRLENSLMPRELSGAYVSCYTSAEDYVEGAEKSLSKLKADGLYPEEILQPIQVMASELWSEHIKETWREFVTSLPDQLEFDELMLNGGVVYGPFASYK